MKLIAGHEPLAKALALTGKFAEERSTVAALTAMRLKALPGALEIVATNLDVLCTTTIPAQVEAAGETAANAAVLNSFVRSTAGATVDLELAEPVLKLRSGRSRASLPTIPASDFPEPFGLRPAIYSFELDAAVLKRCLAAVSYAVEDEDGGRYFLSGVNWAIVGSHLELCATNGRMLSLIRIAAPAGSEGLPSIIVPDIALPAFAGLVRIEVAETFIRFAGNVGDCRVAITSKLIDGTFPDIHRVIPPATSTATVERKALADAVRRCLPVARYSALDFSHNAEGVLIVCAASLEGGEVVDSLVIEGAGFAVALSGDLLAATLDTLTGEKVEIGLTRIGGPVRFTDPGDADRLAIVLPMRGSVLHRFRPPQA